MSKQENAPVEQQNQAVVFNPFLTLTVDQAAALVTRLNAQWKTSKDGDIRLAANELKCSQSEAAVFIWLKELANDQIDAQAYNRIFASNKAMLEQIAAGSMASLAIIAEDYPKVPDALKRKYRIAMRDAVLAKWFGETATRIVAKLMESTGVQPEKEWMR